MVSIKQLILIMKGINQRFSFLLIILFSAVSSQNCLCQSPLADDNIQKYWHYRERLKNFIVPSDCQGCSNVPASRDPREGEIDELINFEDHLQWMGYYLTMLSTEYE